MRVILVAAGILIALLVIVLLIVIIPMLLVMRGWRRRMDAGGRLMDSLTEADVPTWIARAEDYLAQYPQSPAQEGADNWWDQVYTPDLPADLSDLNIIRIDVVPGGSRWPAAVNFVWMGGMDHTALRIERDVAGGHRVIAHFNDHRSRLIWPIADGEQETGEKQGKPNATEKPHDQ